MLGDDELANELIAALRNQLSLDPQLQVHLVLDKWRNTRSNHQSILHLKQLESQFPNQLNIHLYSPPKSTSKFVELFPERIREIFGVMHCKFYAFDDCLLISGANLSKSYFTERIDRYFVLYNANDLITNCFERMMQSVEGKRVENHCLYESIDGNCIIFPSFQLKSHGMNEDERLAQLLLQFKWKSIPTLASAYFNLPPFKIQNGLNVIVPSKEMHGFHNSKGGAGLIPSFYRWSLNNTSKKIRIFESKKQEASEFHPLASCFHAKGFWAEGSDFNITLIGSSNFNCRGYYRDFEFQLLIASLYSHQLADRMRLDLKRITQDTQSVQPPIKPNFLKRCLLRLVKSFL